ncbi:MAG TPA: CHAT domain-containing protein [Thermoanaerobaculia bacterium]|jgi:hypothetical protein|nr:CHAT domain-containing protein [Thermoanaerobaculia bacterium]
MSDKLKLLFLSASPVEEDVLRSDVEIRKIHQRIASSLDRKRFEVTAYFAVRTSDLQRILLEHTPNILHFSGHGNEEDGIYLENDLGRATPVSGEALAGLFAAFKGTLQIVFLNGCETRAMAEAFRYIVEYTIVMKRWVSDDGAIIFATAFYQALALRRTVPDAFSLAVTQLKIDRISEPDTPELLLGMTRVEAKPDAPKARKKEPKHGGSGITTTITGSTVRDVITLQGNNNKVKR